MVFAIIFARICHRQTCTPPSSQLPPPSHLPPPSSHLPPLSRLSKSNTGSSGADTNSDCTKKKLAHRPLHKDVHGHRDTLEW